MKTGHGQRTEFFRKALYRMRVLHQVFHVWLELIERSWLVLSTYWKSADALDWLQWRWFWTLLRNVKAADKVTGFRRLSALPGWTKWELFALFPILNESSFRTLTCLLAKAQEGNDAALAPSLLHGSSIQPTTKKGHSYGGYLANLLNILTV